MEAKYRKKKKLANNLRWAKNEASAVFDNDALSPFTKAWSVGQIYKSALRKARPKKIPHIVSRKHLSGTPWKKSGRKFKLVDSRLKKDLRAQKHITKRKTQRKKVKY